MRIRLDDLRPRGPNSSRVRWYRAFRGYGRADELAEKLGDYVRQRRISDTVCGMRIEKRPRGEFYFFVALETEYIGVLPPEIDDELSACPLLRHHIEGDYELEEIRSMVGSELRLAALGQCINYRKLQQEVSEDPFRIVDSATEEWDNRAERLLWYLSAIGAGRWDKYRTVSFALGSSGPGEAARISRSLRLLGHMEVSHDGARWSVTPPAAIQVPSHDGTTLTYRTGARKMSTPGNRTSQVRAPDRVSADDESEYLYHPALGVTEALPTVQEYARLLPKVEGVSPTGHQFNSYDGKRFVDTQFQGEPGFYEVVARSERKAALYFDGQSWARGDWYGLRYLYQYGRGLILPARYDAASWILAIPLHQRPPELFERALVLSSGLVPDRVDNWYVYSNVDPIVASNVCQQLCMPLDTASL